MGGFLTPRYRIADSPYDYGLSVLLADSRAQNNGVLSHTFRDILIVHQKYLAIAMTLSFGKFSTTYRREN